jgi:hypothetical protein
MLLLEQGYGLISINGRKDRKSEAFGHLLGY